LPLVLQIAVPRQLAEQAWATTDPVAAAARLAARVEPDLLLVPLTAGALVQRPWACVLRSEGPAALEAEVDRACARGARGFAASLKPPGGPLDEVTLLERAAPLAAALRARVEDALVAA
jgi:hypothetical protein